MLIVLLSQSQNDISKKEPQHASTKQRKLVPVPRPVILVTLEVQKLVTIRKTLGGAGSLILDHGEEASEQES